MLTRFRSNLEIFISPDKAAAEEKDDEHQDMSAVEVMKRLGPPDPPAGRPVALSDPSGGLCAVLTWSSPPYDGGRCVDGYVVEGRTESETEWRVVAERCHSLSAVVRDLAPGRRHVFRVRAENVHGQGDPSASSLPFCTPALTECGDEPPPPPFAPRVVTVEPLEEFATRFELLEELGKGRYGTVHRVTERATGLVLAAKLIRTIKAKDRQLVQDEIAVMNLLRHPKLLQLAAAFEGPREMVMVMEYISGGELFERVVADDFTLTERDCILFMCQICEGVDYMHQNQVVHLDLKPENIMCQTRTSHQIKLIDFGLAQKLKPDTPVRVLFGTPEFIPPEIINYEPIGVESDMWSVGVICYVLLSGLSPFMGDNDAETFANITRADFDFDDEAFDAISQDARDFISSLLVKRKEKRLTARQCLEHSWLAQQPASMSCIALSTDKLKKFIIRRKWQKTGNAIRALGRMATLSAASRRNSAASTTSTPASISAPSSPSLSRAVRPLHTGSLCSEDSVEEASLVAEVNATPTTVVACAQDRIAGEVEEAVTATLVPRGRFRSERSDSGISDCSSASSRHRGEPQPLSAPAVLFGKKFSISEEADESSLPQSCGRVEVAPAPATRPSQLPLVLSPAPTPSSASLPSSSVSNASRASDGTSTVSRRSAELLLKLVPNSSVHTLSPAPAASATTPGAPTAATAVGAAAPAGHAPHKATGVRERVGANGLRSPTKTRPPIGFVESKIKSLERQGQSPSKVSVTVVPPRERVSLRDTWRTPPSKAVSPAGKDRLALSPSPVRRDLAVSPARKDLVVSPARRDWTASSDRSSPSRRAVPASPGRVTTTSSSSPCGGSPTSRLQPTTTPPCPRKAPLDTGLGLCRRTPLPQDSPPKSPTLRRMLDPTKLGTHSAGFQKTLEFWKR